MGGLWPAGSRGGGGGGGGHEFVDTIPAAADARLGRGYIRNSDYGVFSRTFETIAAIDGTITRAVFNSPVAGANWVGASRTEPAVPATQPSYYYNADLHGLYYNADPLVGTAASVTLSEFTTPNSGTFVGIFAYEDEPDPELPGARYYFRTTPGSVAGDTGIYRWKYSAGGAGATWGNANIFDVTANTNARWLGEFHSGSPYWITNTQFVRSGPLFTAWREDNPNDPNDANTFSSSHVYYFYDRNNNRIVQVTGYTAGVDVPAAVAFGAPSVMAGLTFNGADAVDPAGVSTQHQFYFNTAMGLGNGQWRESVSGSTAWGNITLTTAIGYFGLAGQSVVFYGLTTDTEAEILAQLALAGYQPNTTYLRWDAAASTIQVITSYTAPQDYDRGSWARSRNNSARFYDDLFPAPFRMLGVSAVEFGSFHPELRPSESTDVHSQAAVIAYFDEHDSFEDDPTYYYYDEDDGDIYGVTDYTPTVPSYPNPIIVRIGGAGLTIRNPPNIFTGATLAACRTARTTYFNNAANAAVLDEYQENSNLAIILDPTGADNNVYETYAPGHEGEAYNSAHWLGRTDTVRGDRGSEGPQGRFTVHAYINAATAPTAAPTGGTYVINTGTLTVPTSYTAVPSTPPDGQIIYRADATINPATDANTLALTWSVPYAPPADEAVERAEAAATAAESSKDDAETAVANTLVLANTASLAESAAAASATAAQSSEDDAETAETGAEAAQAAAEAAAAEAALNAATAGAGMIIGDVWSGDIAITTASQWKALGTNPVPDTAVYLLWNGGTLSGGADDGPAALVTWIDAARWRALTADTVDTTPDDGTGMLMVDWVAEDVGGGAPDFDRRDAVIGRQANDVPLITSKDTGESFYGASLKYIAQAAGSPGTSGTHGDDGRNLFIQFSTTGTAWSDAPTGTTRYMRTASALTKPADDSSSWSAAIQIRGSDGEDGDTGEPGSGATISVEQQDGTLLSNIERLEFEGTGVTVEGDGTEAVITIKGDAVVEDISDTHLLPTPTEDSPDLLVDRTQDTLYLKTERHVELATGTPASVTTTTINVGSGVLENFKGLHGITPSGGSIGQFFLRGSHSNQGHWEHYINDPTLGDGWYTTSFHDISGDPFGADAVWLGIRTPRDAASRIQAQGYDATKTYYFIDSSTVGRSPFKEVDTFTAAVTSETIYSYTSLNLSAAGEIVFEDISDTHELPTPTQTSPDLVVDRTQDTLWLKTEDYLHTTPPSVTSSAVAITGHFLGVRLIHPTLASVGDYYYSNRQGSQHWWGYVTDPTYGNIWVTRDFRNLPGTPFGDDDVFLGIRSKLGAAERISGLGYNSAKTYYFVNENHSRLEEVGTFTAGTDAGTIYSYVALNLSATSDLIAGYLGGLPQPTEALVGALRVHEVTGEMWTCIRETKAQTHSTGTFNDLTVPSTAAIVASLADAAAAVEDSELYVVDEDQFYTGVEIRSGTVDWVADDPQDALDDFDSTVFTGLAHWMGQFRSDTPALETIPTIDTARIYAYYNLAEGTIRYLSNSTFVAAGTPYTHPKWIPTKGDNRLIRVVRPDHMGRWPKVDESDLNRTIGLKGGRLYTAQVHREFDTSVTNTFANVATDGTDALLANFRGAFAQHGGTYSATDYDVDDYIYLHDTDTWLKVFQPGSTKYFTGRHAPAAFVGHFASQADALAKYDFDTITASDTPTQAAWTGAAVQKLTVHTSRTVENSTYFMGIPPSLTNTAGGQESPVEDGVSALTPGYVHTLFYKYATTKPAVHAANWRFADEWSNITGPPSNSYYFSAAEALLNAELNPSFVEANNTLWECRGRFRRRLNTDGDAYVYNDSKEVFAVFGEQFSEDAESWHGTQTDDDIWQRIREPLGDWGTPTYIGPPAGVEWEVLRTFVNAYRTTAVPARPSMVADLSQYRDLRFRMYGLASGVTRRALITEKVLTRPDGGWPVTDDEAGVVVEDTTFQWKYGAAGPILNLGLMGSQHLEPQLAGHATQNVVDDSDTSINYVVTIGAGGRLNFHSPTNSEDDVDELVIFDQPGTFQRVRIEISGRA